MNSRSIKRGMKQEPKASPKAPPEASPEQLKQLETMKAAITDMIYSPETKGSVQKMLSEGDIKMTLPGAVNTVFSRFEEIMTEKNGKMPLDLKLQGGVHTFSELMELGQHMGVIPELGDEEIQPLLKDTIQQYIQKGLKDKSIDPIELQTAVEPLLNDEESEMGMNMGMEQGVPRGLTGTQSQEGIMNSKMQPLEVENQGLKQQNQQMQGALKGISQAPQGGQNGL